MMGANPVAYNAACIITIDGEISADRLAASIREAVRSGWLLSARVVFDAGALKWQESDPSECSVVAEAGREAACVADGMAALSEVFFKSPLRADGALLISEHIVRIKPNLHLVMFRHHHVLLDFHANATLIRNVAAIYNGQSLAPATVSRADTSSAEVSYLGSDIYDEDMRYWRDRLQGLAVNSLWDAFQDRQAGIRTDFVIPPAEFAAFSAKSREMGSTPFQALLLIIYAHLAPKRDEDFVFGIPFANRVPGNAEALASLSRILPFRLSMVPCMPLGEALGSIRRSLKSDMVRARFPIWENAAHIFPRAPRGALPRVALNYMRTSPINFGAASAAVSSVLYGERNAETYIRCIEETDGSLSISLDDASDRQVGEYLGGAMRGALRSFSVDPQGAREIGTLI